MNHLIISREYPPAPYAGGGIGTYLHHISRLLAEEGETVHVIGQQWPGAPRVRDTRLNGRLIIHRVPPDLPALPANGQSASDSAALAAFRAASLPAKAFMWQAALLAESLVEHASIDVIEAQEYEGPLYLLMLRRAEGLGPPRRVPIVVHLHSPTEFVFQANGWDQRVPEYLPLMQVEEYTIRAADARLCPSRFLARMAEARYRLEPGSIQVIPYPMGDTEFVARDESTWRDGTICYIGRLEPRKGVGEWIDAATSAALQHSSARFALIGGDTSYAGVGDRSTRDELGARIPAALRARFTFVNTVPPHQLANYRRQARIAVVPSRWENLPYACIEAMASGLPVLVSPAGGMKEMVDDGRTGWVAGGSDARNLETALMRALSTPPQAISEMGAAAAASIRAFCGNEAIVRHHVDFRTRVVSGRCRPRADLPAPPLLAAGVPPRERAAATDVLPGGTMTLLDLLRAAPRQQLAVIRRALANPRYVLQWLAWHGQRAIGRARR